MLSGFYTAASGLLMQQRNLNVSSNNVANLKTPGYKAQQVISTTFAEVLVTRQERNNSQVIGGRTQMRVLDDVFSDFEPNYLEETGRELDFAISGEGFFNIQGQDRNYLTRNGSFEIDEEGYLVLAGVGRVLGKDGPLRVVTNDFTVEADGTVKNAKDRKIGQLLITQPADLQGLSQAPNGLYFLNNEEDNLPGQSFRIMQKHLESSNVDMNRELTQIMEAQRSIQSCSTVLKGIDEINGLAVNQIAKL